MRDFEAKTSLNTPIRSTEKLKTLKEILHDNEYDPLKVEVNSNDFQ